mmetsp:Transcript_21854/g.54941  ORF Transcript_21854/g.54941 Transcript_21854/m.54941 type:complete len:485 (+) Transcript_21854:72-1526(+)
MESPREGDAAEESHAARIVRDVRAGNLAGLATLLPWATSTRSVSASSSAGSSASSFASTSTSPLPLVYLAPGSVEEAASMMRYAWAGGHLERAERLCAGLCALRDLHRHHGCRMVPAQRRVATDAELLVAHSERFVAELRAFEAPTSSAAVPGSEKAQEPRVGRAGSEKVASEPADESHVARSLYNVSNGVLSRAGLRHIAAASRLACGSVLWLSEQPGVQLGMALVRPPGHHGTREQSGGNGLVNSVAVAAVCAAKAGRRVLVVDWDVHFSGGSAEIVSQCATADGGGVGPLRMVDVFGARGQEVYQHARREGRRWQVLERIRNVVCVNVALLDRRAGDAVYLGAEVWPQVERAFAELRPQLVLVSCGLDAARGDCEGFQVSAYGFGEMTRRLVLLCRAARLDSGSSTEATTSSASVASSSGSSAPPESLSSCGSSLERQATESSECRLVLALEGGYQLPAIYSGIHQCMLGLLEPDQVQVVG